MAKLLVWNIQKFSQNKIMKPVGIPTFSGAGAPASPASVVPPTPASAAPVKAVPACAGAYRLAYILNRVDGKNILTPSPAPAAADPADIFVVLETMAGSPVPMTGSTIVGDAATGILGLLHSLRYTTGDQWQLIPPIKTGSAGAAQEGVAVFYRGDLYRFKGPWLWNGFEGKPVVALPSAYGANWTGCLPAGQSHMAGQWKFSKATSTPHAPALITFPHNFDRTPFLVDLEEISAPNRNMRLLLTHNARPGPDAGPGIRSIAEITEMQTSTAAAGVNIIAGDFNVPLNTNSTQYNPLGSGNFLYWMGIPQPSPSDQKSTVHTSIKLALFATPMGNAPGYQYSSEAYDNIFYAVIGPVPSTSPPNIAIANGILQCPYKSITPFYGIYRTPATQMSSIQSMSATPPATGKKGKKKKATPGTPTPAADTYFRQWHQYGSIIATSDHIGVFIDI